jgi:hypothetical protein
MQSGEAQPPIPFANLLPWASQLMQAQGFYLASAAAFDQQMTMFYATIGS